MSVPQPSTSAAGFRISPFPPIPEYAANYTDENIKSGMIMLPPPMPVKFTVFNEEQDLEGVVLCSI